MSVKKAALAAAFLRADPHSVPRDGIAKFHSFLDEVMSIGTSAAIQRCKEWLVENAAPSGARINALGKYLTSLALDVLPSEPGKNGHQPNKPEASLRRKRLRILYLINDLFHHTKHHSQQSALFTNVATQLESHLIELVEAAASFEASKNKKLHQRLHNTVNIWEKNEYYGKDFCNKLRETLDTAGKTSGNAEAKSQDINAISNGNLRADGSDVPSALPAIHGDRTAHWSDLPAACNMRLVVPNSKKPIRVRDLKPLELNNRPANPEMIAVVKRFLQTADKVYNPYPPDDEGIVADIDEMGQSYFRNKDNGELEPGETYYGWSRKFAENMRKRRRARSDNDARGRGRNRHSRSRSSSREYGFNKRRRYSSSSSISHSSPRPPPQSHANRKYSSDSYTPPRSPTPRRSSYDHRGGPSSPAQSPSQPRSRLRHRSSSHGRSRSPSRSRSRRRERSPTGSSHGGGNRWRTRSSPSHRGSLNDQSFANLPQPPFQAFAPAPLPFVQSHGAAPPPPPPPPPANIVIPPRPPNWNGPWPPPPPPPPLQMMQQGDQLGSNGYGRGWNAPGPFPGGGWGMGGQGWGRGAWRG
ncbi:MAG: hypothetical protein M1821_006692 [Bathelium mastoideum]|nr:MAG: hypothetical protein M1821_006692 [Bathelium mastoideum]KAI9685172.1 MAG: hypothetical protein M1822_004759 [Bathelium mastoideum]